MNTQPDVYLFGQVLGPHSFLLKGGFLQPDEYAEIKAQYFLPGGETGAAATVLDSLGISVRMDGTWIGTEVAPMLQAFYRDRKVDLSPLENLRFIREAGMAAFLERERKQWTCSACGGVICVHTGVCSGCGRQYAGSMEH